MKFASLSFASLALWCAAASAEYLSEGWKPGQAVTSTRHAAPQYTPGSQPDGQGAGKAGASSRFSWTNVLTQGPIGSLLAKAGINLTEGLAKAEAAAYSELWDNRIPLITDDNYEEMIVNEPLTPEEEAKRTWFLMITTAAGQQQQGGISKLVDEQFDAAYNTTLIENDLPSVRWGRIDYLNVTYLTTKWNVWRGPFLVVLKDRGQSLRFYTANQVRINSTIMRNFLKDESWQHTEPWDSGFAPGGSREFILHYFALYLQKLYLLIAPVPRFLLMIGTGALGSLLTGLLHRGSQKESAKVEQKPKTPLVAAKPAGPVTPAASPAGKKGSVKGKKGGKK